MNKILTVVVPTYNMEKYLRRCLDSLIIKDENLFDTLEVLVVIDGGNDSSSNIAHEYQDKFPQVFRVIDKENGGHGSCCNVGIREGRGKYIHFLDSDDWFDEYNFPLYLQRLQKETSDVVVTQRMDEYVSSGTSEKHSFSSITYEKKYSFDEMRGKGFSFSLHEVSYNTDNLRKFDIRFQEKVSYDDTILRFAGFLGTNKLAFYDMVLYHYMLGREGQSVDMITFTRKFNQFYAQIEDLFMNYKRVRNVSEIQNEFLREVLNININWAYSQALKLPYTNSKLYLDKLDKLFNENKTNCGLTEMRSIRLYHRMPFALLHVICGILLKFKVISR